MSIFFAELVGTFLLILLGNGVTANAILPKTKGENSGWIVITTGWALAVTLSVYLVGFISGAHINPAVSIAFLLAGKITLSELPLYLIGQFIGAFLGAYGVYAIYHTHFYAEKDSAYKLMSFCTKPQTKNNFFNFLTETVATFVLVLAIFSISDPRNQIQPGFGPFLVGLIVFSIGLSLGGTTGYAINPARDFSPRLVHSLISFPKKGSSEWAYAWVPFVGPILGGILAYLFYYKVFLSFA